MDHEPSEPTLEQLYAFLEEAEQRIPTLEKEIRDLEERLKYKRSALDLWKQRLVEMKKKAKSKRLAEAKKKWADRREELQRGLTGERP